MTMSTPNENPKYRISKILIGQPYIINQPDNIMIPASDVRVIVENGGIYGRTFLSFGLNENTIRDAWDKEHDKFQKIDPHTGTP